MATPDTGAAAVDELVPFVPRLTIEWLSKSPDLRWLELEGTLAFIDISGFTAMSEKLSSSGRAGAEEVTEVMNRTFAALLDVAYAQGGGLLKFGGDALLLLYDGEDHAQRAARAAFEMRSTLRKIGRPRTSVGAVQLKMHAGIHSGVFQFFLVGESHRELLVTGPSASRTVEMEGASEAGEILLSPETAAVLPPETVGDEKGPGFLLQAAPEAEGTLAPLPDVGEIPLELAVPAPLRAQLLEVGPLEGEHRHAAVAFVRYSGVDEIISTEGAVSAAEAIDALASTLQAAADEHKVTFLESDVDRDGGRIILVSGAPQTFGDDEERLLRTVRSAVDAGLPLPVHVGVSEGRVFTGQVGAPFRRTYTILGDTAALAARLMAKAGEDEIWVAASAYERGGARFEASELEPLELKGKSEPVRAFVLGDLVPEAERAEEAAAAGDKLPFVDRERERAVLGASVAPVRMGFGTMVELIGEPGIGKSRLAEELESNCADMRKVGARCDQYEANTPYYPFRPLLRSLLDVDLNGGGDHNRTVLAERLATVDEELVPWAPLLGAPLDVEVESTPEVDDLDPAFWRARLHGVMGKLLGGILDSPTLLLFEDVHWMDDASSELLRYLGTQLPTRPWLTCTTRRPVEGGFAAAEGTPPVPALSLRLEPIPEEDAKTLVRAAAGDRALNDEELAALMERGAGNPLFLQELASSGDATEAAREMPDTVEELVATRIDKLAPGDRTLLRWASVLGVSFSGSLIADVLEGDPNVAAASDAWARLAEFVEMDPHVPGAFRFRHALIRDAAYEGLSYKRRRELHGRVAEVIEHRQGDRPEEAAELLSLHYFNGGRWEEAWRYSRLAGNLAREVYANVDAARFYERALDAGAQIPGLDDRELASTWRSLGEVRDAAGDYPGALDAFEAALKPLEDDPIAQAEIYEARALAHIRLSAYDDALDETTAGLDRLSPSNSPEAGRAESRLLARRAQIYLQQARPRETIEIATRIIEEAEPLGPSIALARAYSALEGAYLSIGEPEKAVYEEKALDIFRSLGELRSAATMEMNLGVKAYAQGRWQEATRLYDSARAEFERVGDATEAAQAGANLGEVLISRGLFDEAAEVLEDARDALRASNFVYAAVFCEIQIARLAIAIGDSTEAITELIRLVEEARSSGDVSYAVEALVHLADAYAHVGDPVGSLSALEDADGLLDDDASPLRAPLVRVRARALMLQGDLGRAGEELSTAIEIARSQGLGYEEVLALRALAELARMQGRAADADDALHEADRLMQRVSGSP